MDVEQQKKWGCVEYQRMRRRRRRWSRAFHNPRHRPCRPVTPPCMAAADCCNKRGHCKSWNRRSHDDDDDDDDHSTNRSRICPRYWMHRPLNYPQTILHLESPSSLLLPDATVPSPWLFFQQSQNSRVNPSPERKPRFTKTHLQFNLSPIITQFWTKPKFW
jgi:hypothetical protein